MTERASNKRPRKTRRILGLALGLLVFGLLASLPIRAWMKGHLEQMTGAPDHSLTSCGSCHGGSRRPRPLLKGDTADLRGLLSVSKGLVAVAAAGDDSLLLIEPAKGRLRARLRIPGRPFGLALAGPEKLLVTAQSSDELVVYDLGQRKERARIPVGREPCGVAAIPGRDLALVANRSGDTVSLVDLREGAERLRFSAGREPTAIALDPRATVAVVVNRLSSSHGLRTPPSGELTIIDLKHLKVRARPVLPSVHMMEHVAVTPDGALALATGVMTRNLVPTSQIGRSWVASHVLVVQELGGEMRTLPIILDAENRHQPDLSGLAVSPDGKRLYLGVGGADRLLVVDLVRVRTLLETLSKEELNVLSRRQGPGAALVQREVELRADPRAVTISMDGASLLVAERLADSLAVLDAETLEPRARIELGAAGPGSPRLIGERLFHKATALRQQFSCRTCHPDGHLDGLTYDFAIDGLGENLLDNRSLRGLAGTAPYKWIGLNPSISVQCGPRFSRVLGRGAAFSPQELEAMTAYVEAVPLVNRPRPATRDPGVARGRELFYRTQTNSGEPIPVEQRCPSCHPAPTFTHRARARVGTGSESDFTDVFDTPHLLDLRYGAPYLHDGRARTLHEVFSRPSWAEGHGVTHDLTRVQRNDLVDYLRTL